MGSTTWTGSGENEWIVDPNDALWYLDSHVMNTCGSSLSGTGSANGSCIDEISNFTAAGVSGTPGYTIGWDYGDGSANEIGAIQTHNFATAGTYNITYVILDGAFNIYSETFTLTVFNAPTACYTTNTQNGCSPDTLTYVDCTSGGGTPYNYNWTFGNGNTSTVSAPGAQTYTAGTFNANLIIVDANSCNDTISTIVTVNPSEDASFTYAQSTYCPSDPNPTPTITGTTGGVFTCNGCSINPTTGQINISGTTNGSYIVNYTTAGICSASQNFPISIFSTAPDATITAGGPYCSTDSPVTLVAASGGGIWSGIGITNSSTGEFDPSLAIGTNTITYTIGGSCGSTDTEDFVVNTTPDATITPISPVCEIGTAFNMISATPGGTWSGIGITDANLGTFDPTVAGDGCHNITYSISGTCPATDDYLMCVVANENVAIVNIDTTVCNNFFGFFLEANTGGVWTGTYVNDNLNGDGFFSSSGVPAGNYYAVYTISGMCGDADSILVQVGDTPTASFTFVNNGVTVDLTNTSIGGSTYLWEVTENAVPTTSTSTNYIYTYNDPTEILTICLTVTSSLGCEMVHCETVGSNGVNEFDVNLISIYPNPSNGMIRISNDQQLKINTVTIVNLLGEQLLSREINLNSTYLEFNLNHLPDGTYFINLTTEKGSITKKLIKSN